MPATPKFDPMNPSAYEAPELPQVAPPPEPTQKQDSPQYAQPAVYPGKVGSAALIATDVMKGFTDGIAKARIMNAQKMQRQSQAVQASYNLAARNLSDLATSMNVTPQQMAEFRAGKRPTGLSDDDFKRLSEANQAVQGSWQAWTSWQGQHIDQGKGAKGKGKKGDQPQQGNILSRIGAAMRGNDPAAVSREVYQFWVQNGPPVYHQLDSQLADSEQRAKAKAAQTTEADVEGKLGTLKNNLLTLETSPVPADPKQAQERETKIEQARNALIETQDSLNPSMASKTFKRYRQGPNGQTLQFEVDAAGNEIPNSERPLSASNAGPPKPLKYDQATDRVIDPNTGKQYTPSDPNLPPEIASVFEGVKRSLANKAVTTTGTHTVMVWQGNQEVPVEVQTTTTRTPGGAHAAPADAGPSSTHAKPEQRSESHPKSNSGVVSTGAPVGFKYSPEYTGLNKQYLAQKSEFDSIAKDERYMIDASKQAVRGDGAAQVGIIASYLKNVIGGHGTGLRITKAEWDAAAKTRPWIQGIQATFSPAGVMTGAAISPQQVQQMLQQVHEKTKATHDQMLASKQAADALLEKDRANLKPNNAPETHNFSVSAWKAANPKGDVEAAKAAAKAAKYTVVE